MHVKVTVAPAIMGEGGEDIKEMFAGAVYEKREITARVSNQYLPIVVCGP